jgi:hypothetical protein
MARNVIDVNGGEVHLPSRLDEIEELAFPFCHSGPQASSETKYIPTDGKVTCKACKDRLKGEAKKNIMSHTGAVHAPGRYFKQLSAIGPKCIASASALARWHFGIPTDSDVTCRRCLAALAKEAGSAKPAEPIEVPAEPAPIPENWLHMAKHAATETARAWWRKKCGITEEN